MYDIDNVLVSLGMGRYQITDCLLFGLILMYSSVSPYNYVFTARDLKYRCEIPECDPPNPTQRIYQPDWLQFTTPLKSGSKFPRKCQRYAPVSVLSDALSNSMRCTASGFDMNKTTKCHDRWVFEDSENTIGTEFGLMCEHSKLMLTMVGTVNNVGQFIGIPVSGVIADKFGRKFTMIFCAAVSAAISIVQSFSNDYLTFITLELLSSTIASGLYTVTFILAMELVLPNHRVFYYSILECFIPLGGMLVAFIASQVKDWRLLLRVSNIPGLMFVSYYWFTEESMRWLEMQGKHDKVVDVLKKIATVNKKDMPNLENNLKNENSVCVDDKLSLNLLKETIRSSSIFWRMIRCSCVWIAVTLVYFGLTINSTDIVGDKYVNFALVSLVEIPACLLNWLLMERLSRKMALSSMLMLSGVSCFMYNLTPANYFIIKLSLFMIGKLVISCAFCIIYMLTAEIFPTQLRATMLSMCSMLGRIGSMIAPQTSLLEEYFGEYVIMLVFSISALVAAVITITLPESKNIKLPDTIDEAENIQNNIKPENSRVPA